MSRRPWPRSPRRTARAGVQIAHRLGLTPLDDGKRGERGGGESKQRGRRRRPPAPIATLDQRHDERGDADRERHLTGPLDRSGGWVARRLDVAPRDDDREGDDGEVHEEDPAPVGQLDDRAADERAQRHGRAEDRAERAQGLGTIRARVSWPQDRQTGGKSMAPPTPWIPRAMMRAVGEPATPHSAGAAPKTSRPMTKTVGGRPGRRGHRCSAAAPRA